MAIDFVKVFDKFNSLNILIIGDVMIDAYWWGGVNRISPEAPVPVCAVNDKESRLGGAANVALNIAAMGANPILCSVVGEDYQGHQLCELMEKQNMDTKGIVFSALEFSTFLDVETVNHSSESSFSFLEGLIMNKLFTSSIF